MRKVIVLSVVILLVVVLDFLGGAYAYREGYVRMPIRQALKVFHFARPSVMSPLASRLMAQLQAVEPRFSFKATNIGEWRQWRAGLKAALVEVLGGFPESRVELDAKVVQEEEFDDFYRQKVVFTSEPGVRIPAYLSIPKGIKTPAPAIVVFPGHGEGIVETAGIVESYQRSNAKVLAEKGFITITPEARGFGELEAGSDHLILDNEAKLIGKTFLGMLVWDGIRTIDYLSTRPEVDKTRIGVAGISLGGEWSLFVAALDSRVSVAIVSGFLGEYRLNRWPCSCFYIPGILKYAEVSDIASLIAPRPLLIQHGEFDTGFPIELAWRSFQEIEKAYAFLGSRNSLSFFQHAGIHTFDNDSAYEWFKKWL